MEQELLILPERMSSHSVFSGVRVFSFLCIGMYIIACPFVFFIRPLYYIVHVLRFTPSYYPIGIFKLFLIVIGSKIVKLYAGGKVNVVLL